MTPSAVRLAELALSLSGTALRHAGQTCRYHGTDFERYGMWMGMPRCDSCKQPYRVTLALAAIERATAAIEAKP